MARSSTGNDLAQPAVKTAANTTELRITNLVSILTDRMEKPDPWVEQPWILAAVPGYKVDPRTLPNALTERAARAKKREAAESASRKMLERDLKLLQEANVPIEKDLNYVSPQTGNIVTRIRINSDRWVIEPMQLTEAEKEVLYVMRHVDGSAKWDGLREAVWQKLITLGLEPAEVDDSVFLHTHAEDLEIAHAPVFHELYTAIDQHKRVTFLHRSSSQGPKATPKKRVFDPYEIVSRRQRLYLVGWDEDRRTEISVRLAWISDIRIIGPAKHQPPEGFSARQLVEDFLSVSSLLTSAELRTDATLPPELASEATQTGPRSWHIDSMPKSDLLPVVLLGDGGLEVTGPPQLREDVISRLENCRMAHAFEAAQFTVDPLPQKPVRPSKAQVKTPQTGVSFESLSHLNRLLTLTGYIKRHPDCTYESVAAAFGVSVDQLRDDVDTLDRCAGPDSFIPDDGVCVYGDEDGRLVVGKDQGLGRPLSITAVELRTLMVYLDTLEDYPEHVELEAIHSLKQKFYKAAGLPLDQLQSAAAPLSEAAAPAERGRGVTAKIRQALSDKKAVDVEYFSASTGQTSWRRVFPVRAFTAANRPMLLAVRADTGHRRTYRFDRIMAVRNTEVPTPEEVLNTSFDADDPLGLKSADHRVRLVVREDAKWVPLYYEMDVEGSATVNGETVFVVTTPLLSREWISALAAYHGGAVEIVEPADVRQHVFDHCVRLLGAYDR